MGLKAQQHYFIAPLGKKKKMHVRFLLAQTGRFLKCFSWFDSSRLCLPFQGRHYVLFKPDLLPHDILWGEGNLALKANTQFNKFFLIILKVTEIVLRPMRKTKLNITWSPGSRAVEYKYYYLVLINLSKVHWHLLETFFQIILLYWDPKITQLFWYMLYKSHVLFYIYFSKISLHNSDNKWYLRITFLFLVIFHLIFLPNLKFIGRH